MGTRETQNVDVLVVGGGPGGLSCATRLAERGRSVILLERKIRIGAKVCAGGITWSGLLQHLPASLIERQFTHQHIYTGLQHVCIHEEKPIIATVNRERMGHWMSMDAMNKGVYVFHNAQALRLTPIGEAEDEPNPDGSPPSAPQGIQVEYRRKGKKMELTCQHVVGADGSNSMVRRFLQLPCQRMGIGVQAMLPQTRAQMEWHLRPQLFGSGYAWIFPHEKEVSIGAYSSSPQAKAKDLRQNLLLWAESQGISLPPEYLRAGRVNCDYQGHDFGRFHLVGDAAGLASGLTGEGIYPAIVSGQAVAETIHARLLENRPQLGQENSDDTSAKPEPQRATDAIIAHIVEKQQMHHTILDRSERYPGLRPLAMEVLLFLLRTKLIGFQSLEMS